MIALRLRIPLYTKTLYRRQLEATTGIVMPPDHRVPARTTLHLIDFGIRDDEHGVFVLTPDRRRVWLSASFLRKHSYTPRNVRRAS